jgi:hypothetical protein
MPHWMLFRTTALPSTSRMRFLTRCRHVCDVCVVCAGALACLTGCCSKRRPCHLHCTKYPSCNASPPPSLKSMSVLCVQVHWHASLDAVPSDGPAIYIAHEFLDALPVHQFMRDPRRGWLEVRNWLIVPIMHCCNVPTHVCMHPSWPQGPTQSLAGAEAIARCSGCLLLQCTTVRLRDPRRGWLEVRTSGASCGANNSVVLVRGYGAWTSFLCSSQLRGSCSAPVHEGPPQRVARGEMPLVSNVFHLCKCVVVLH